MTISFVDTRKPQLTRLEPLPYPVYFVNKNVKKWRSLMESDELPENLESVYESCIEGLDIWSVQTYVHLKQRGLNVHLVPHFVPGQICVVSYHHLMMRDLPFNSYVVACRLDSARPAICEQQTVMNRLCVEQATDHLMHHWPQPTLQPRDPARGTRLETLSFKGGPLNLAAPFRDPAFLQQLSELGIELRCSTGDWLTQFRDWGNYTESDAVIAVRNLTQYDYRVKPAVKLINAWHAGCPALLGPEPAYLDIQRSELDFITVSTPQDVIGALRRLQENPGLYQAMVENGLNRAAEFSTDRIAQQWRDLLAGPITEGYERWQRQSTLQKLCRPLQFVQRALQHKREVKHYLYHRDNGIRSSGVEVNLNGLGSYPANGLIIAEA